MKKLVIFFSVAVLSLFTTQAQEFKGGVSAAIPTGDASSAWSFGVTADLVYLFDVGEGFKVGPTIGYKHYFGKDVSFAGFSSKVDDAQFLPVGGSARFGFAEGFSAGADLGYALGITDGIDGGFMYKPFVIYDFGPISAVVSYSGISLDGGSFSSFNFGVEVGF